MPHFPASSVVLCVYCVMQMLTHYVMAINSTDSVQIVQLQTNVQTNAQTNAQTNSPWNVREKIRHLQAKYKLDLVSGQSPSKASWEFLTKPEVLSSLAQDLVKYEIPYRVFPLDKNSDFPNDEVRTKRNGRRKRWASHRRHAVLRHRFLTYEEIGDVLKSIQAESRVRSGVKVDLGSIGQSFEGRETPYVVISNTTSGRRKPVVFIDAGIHGREWISPAMAVEIIYQLTLNPDDDPEVAHLLSLFDWVIVPLVNPDGYVYTFLNDINNRLWRKSRTTRHSDTPDCYGVDLNRNFGFEWNDDPLFGGSSDPCTSTYSGPHSFSEPETRNLRDLLLAHVPSIQAYFSFHSFGQFFLYPWAFSSLVDLDDENDLHHVASAFASTMKKKNYNYHIGGTAKVLYPAAGGSDDYVRGSLGVKYAYTIELPPHETSRYGFLLPEHEVKTVVTDTWEGLKAVMYRLHDQLAKEARGKNVNESAHYSYETVNNVYF